MTYYECSECGQLDRPIDVTESRLYRPCPRCEERTVWEPAFVDDEEGVSF